ncbi:MAG: GntR family transcriptional regulator [Lachnospiraceae bacterium]|nr:GntR family transcriptional regulator [Lachnospiraceae bacterium]
MPNKKLQVNTISRQVYSIIKNSIVSGEYGPNYWLQEVELSKTLGVSRSPIREALKQLSADGLVIEIPNKGTFVREFNEKEIVEVYEIRELLESYAITHLPATLSDEQKEQMEHYKDEFVKFYNEGDLEMYIQVDTNFHRYIIECTGNSILMELYRRVRNMNMLFRIYSLSTQKRFVDSKTEHIDLVDDLVNGNYEDAVKLNAVHLSFAKETAMQHLRQHNNEED